MNPKIIDFVAKYERNGSVIVNLTIESDINFDVRKLIKGWDTAMISVFGSGEEKDITKGQSTDEAARLVSEVVKGK